MPGMANQADTRAHKSRCKGLFPAAAFMRLLFTFWPYGLHTETPCRHIRFCRVSGIGFMVCSVYLTRVLFLRLPYAPVAITPAADRASSANHTMRLLSSPVCGLAIASLPDSPSAGPVSSAGSAASAGSVPSVGSFSSGCPLGSLGSVSFGGSVSSSWPDPGGVLVPPDDPPDPPDSPEPFPSDSGIVFV